MRSESRRHQSRDSAPYVQTFAHLQSQRRHPSRRIPRLGAACAAVLAVAIAIWQSRPGDSPADRNESVRTIVADPRLDTMGITSVPVPPADDVLAEDTSHPSTPAPTPVAETPPAEPDPTPQMAIAQEPEQALPANPPAPQADAARAAPVRSNRTPRPQSAHGVPVYAIRRLLDRYAVEAGSDQQPEGARNLAVQVRLLSIREDGDRAVVRFTQRRHYRDAVGRLVLKETPPMETTVVRTAEGVRLETPPI
jgi:hypothetical protein